MTQIYIGDFQGAIASLMASQRLSPYGINWATYYLAQILQADDNEPKEFFAPSVLTTNENIDNFKGVSGERIPVDTFSFEQVPGVFKRIDKLPG